MLNRRDIAELLVEKEILFARKIDHTQLQSKREIPIDQFCSIDEVFIEDEESETTETQLRKSAIAFSKAIAKHEGRTILKVQGNGRGRISVSLGNSQRNDIMKVLEGSMKGSVSYSKNSSADDDWSSYSALTYSPSIDQEEQVDFISTLDYFIKSHLNEPFEIRIVIRKNEQSEIAEKLSATYEKAYSLLQLQTSISTSESEQTQNSTTDTETGSFIVVGKNNSRSENTSSGTDESNSQSMEYKSLEVEKYCEQLEHLLDRQLLGNSIGQYQVGIYIASTNDLTAIGLEEAIQQSSFEKPYGEMVKVHHSASIKSCFHNCTYPDDELDVSILVGTASQMTNLMNSNELARLIQLPSHSFIGYEVKKMNDFELISEANHQDHRWTMGQQFNRNILTEREVQFDYEALKSHCLISGITGSGKTNTVMSLLKNSPVPYLIIEPTKQEYRHLIQDDSSIRLYTPGDERVSPIRLNPFYFPDGISVMSHIDSLKAVFMSAFSMYASMPNILEQCLYAIYQKVGWDLNRSINIFASKGIEMKHFPTLELLYEEIEKYLDQSSYADEQKSNIRAALLTRIKSLMTGNKGKLLNTSETIDFAHLLQYKSVIELEEIADEDDKALIMGLFFIRLSEQFKIEKNTEIDSSLKHLTIIEEAHRLFRNHEQSNNPEIANTKAKSVEFFCNILSEIRSKGEGMIIIDQVPTKLASDALKNTDTKIIHRLVSQDDAKYVAQSLAISDVEDQLFLSQLKRGEVLYFTSGMYKAGHIKIDPVKNTMSFLESDSIIKHAKTYNEVIQLNHFEHPMAEYLLTQNKSLIKVLLKKYRAFYMSAIYGDVESLNAAVTQFHMILIRNIEKQGYFIEENQIEHFSNSMFKGLTTQFLKHHLYYSKYEELVDELSYYLNLLLVNEKNIWSLEELKIIHSQRTLRIEPAIIQAIERVLFDESDFEWMESSRTVVDGEVIYFADYLKKKGIINMIQVESEASENAKVVFDFALSEIQNQFMNWSWNENTERIVRRTLTQLFGWQSKNLLTQFEIWLQKETVK